MTERQLQIIRALARVSVPFGASKRRSFIRSLEALASNDPERALSAAQLRYMLGLCHVFRRQLSPATLALVHDEQAEGAPGAATAGSRTTSGLQLPLFAR